MRELRFNFLLLTVSLLSLSACSFTDDDFEDPSPFLQYQATATIVEASPSALQVEVQVSNQHRSSDVVLAHSSCNVSIVLTPEDPSLTPAVPNQGCAPITITSTIGSLDSKTFTFQMPVEDILDQGVEAGTYTVTATIRFAQIAQQELDAGTISLSDQS